MPTQTLARIIWSLGLAAIAVLVGLPILTSSRTGLEVSPLPSALYAAGLALVALLLAFPRLRPLLQRIAKLNNKGAAIDAPH